jgi:AAA domain
MISGSVKALREAGIGAQIVASLLANPMPSSTCPELWFIDESSLVATSKANELLKAAREVGVERIVFVGDQRQHHAIEADAPIRQFLADSVGSTGCGRCHGIESAGAAGSGLFIVLLASSLQRSQPFDVRGIAADEALATDDVV